MPPPEGGVVLVDDHGWTTWHGLELKNGVVFYHFGAATVVVVVVLRAEMVWLLDVQFKVNEE